MKYNSKKYVKKYFLLKNFSKYFVNLKTFFKTDIYK